MIAILKMHDSIPEGQRNLGMAFHIIDLFLQFQGVSPIIIPFAECDILPLRSWELNPSPDMNALGVLVFNLIDGFEQGRVCGFEFPDDVGGVVRGSVVVDQDFEGEIRFLADEPLEALPEEGSVVVRFANDTDEGLIDTIHQKEKAV